MAAVSNTSPIIYLAKVDHLILLKEVYELIYLCSPVLDDITYLQKRGLLTQNEVASIDEAKKQGWILLRDPQKEESLVLKDSLMEQALGLGEAYSISLARELKAIFLANDRQAIELARRYGVGTRWFTEILHDALKRGFISDAREYVSILDKCIAKGLYISAKQRERAIRAAERIRGP